VLEKTRNFTDESWGMASYIGYISQNTPKPMKLNLSLALIVIASAVATDIHMSSSLDRLEQAQGKAEIEFQQIKANW
jgi:hypothetical protein